MVVGFGLVVVRFSANFSVSFLFCNLFCCYSLVLYFYKTTLTGKFSEIYCFCVVLCNLSLPLCHLWSYSWSI